MKLMKLKEQERLEELEMAYKLKTEELQMKKEE